MKKTLFYLFTFFLLGYSSVSGQVKEVNLTSGDSLIIELDGHKQGAIQWQRQLSGNTWGVLSSFNDSEALRYVVTTPSYFRANIVDGTCDPIISDTIQANLLYSSSIVAGRCYVESEPYVTARNAGISNGEKNSLRSWTDVNQKAVWFLYQTAGTYKVSFNLAGTSGRIYDFVMNTQQAYDGLGYTPKSFNFSYTGRGPSSAEKVEFFTVTIPTNGYYRYELEAASSTMSGLTINTLVFDSARTPGATTPTSRTTDYLSSPSVHIGFTSTTTNSKNYDWIYEEILVPEGYDPVASYYMSIGFFRGYMGIQTNSYTERRVLFSVWDIVDTDSWPDAPSEALVSLVDKAEYTTANSFGGEGTGGQSYVGLNDFNTWKTGTPVKFLMNCRRDGGILAPETIHKGNLYIDKGDSIKHTIISAWYNAGDDWKYIASWRTPCTETAVNMFNGFHSFLENYGWTNGQAPRKAYYYNAYVKDRNTGGWVHQNQVSYSNTDGSWGQRIDFEQGVAPEDPTKFYMLSGGYGETVKTDTKTVPYVDIDNFPYLKNLDLTPFQNRVTQALEREEYLENLTYYDQTKWTVVSFSSEETSGESNGNGRAVKIIDGDESTYWHSRWTSGGSAYPHYFIIDINDTKDEEINGFRFVSSGGTNRYPKDTDIQVSNSSTGNWTTIWTGELPVSPALLELDTPVTGYRYIKINMKNGYADPPHTRMNEIYAF
ncbi:DUF3472 domain-containing protein [Bacteroidales bacterium OttesenSCG-928-M11]|nr:DUF3472 domain-containing protein [Bacteroidales bacterium OttesenSCG-928-M11]